MWASPSRTAPPSWPSRPRLKPNSWLGDGWEVSNKVSLTTQLDLVRGSTKTGKRMRVPPSSRFFPNRTSPGHSQLCSASSIPHKQTTNVLQNQILGSDTIGGKDWPLAEKGPSVKVGVAGACHALPHQRQPLLPCRVEGGQRDERLLKDFILRRSTSLNVVLGKLTCYKGRISLREHNFDLLLPSSLE